MDKQIVIFELATNPFGVDIGAVESIVKMQEITRMPQAPAFVEGVTNLRGRVLPVIDLRKRLDLDAVERDKDTRIVVVSLDDMQIGMIVDSVTEVLTISEQTIEKAPAVISGVKSEYITGIAKLDDRLVILLDLRRVLTRDEMNKLADTAL